MARYLRRLPSSVASICSGGFAVLSPIASPSSHLRRPTSDPDLALHNPTPSPAARRIHKSRRARTPSRRRVGSYTNGRVVCMRVRFVGNGSGGTFCGRNGCRSGRPELVRGSVRSGIAGAMSAGSDSPTAPQVDLSQFCSRFLLTDSDIDRSLRK